MYELLTGYPPLYGKDKHEAYKKASEVFISYSAKYRII